MKLIKIILILICIISLSFALESELERKKHHKHKHSTGAPGDKFKAAINGIHQHDLFKAHPERFPDKKYGDDTAVKWENALKEVFGIDIQNHGLNPPSNAAGNAGAQNRPISLYDLKRVQNFFIKMGQPVDAQPGTKLNLYVVNTQLILPLTYFFQDQHSSFVDVVKQGYQPPSSGQINGPYFVSHWWQSSFDNLVQSLSRHCESIGGACSEDDEKTYFYWICAFANDQYDLGLGDDAGIEQSAFALAINQSKQFLAIQDIVQNSADDTNNFFRCWCEYEMFKALIKKKQDPSYLILFVCAGSCTEAQQSRFFVTTLPNFKFEVDVPRRCSSDGDSQKIQEAVNAQGAQLCIPGGETNAVKCFENAIHNIRYTVYESKIADRLLDLSTPVAFKKKNIRKHRKLRKHKKHHLRY